MFFMKRAYLHTLRKRGKTFLMFGILLVISTLLLACISIYSATDTATTNVRKSLFGYFTINAKQLAQGLTEDDVSKILAIDGIKKNYNARSYTEASLLSLNKEALEIKTEGASEIPAGYEHAGKIVSTKNSTLDTYFTEAGFELVEGSAIGSEDINSVLIHEDFANKNHMSIGETFILNNVSDSTKSSTVKIIGIFTNTKTQDSIGVAPSYDLYENVIFADTTTGSQLLYSDGHQHYQYADFYVTDPEMLDSIITEVKQLKDLKLENSIVTKYDKDYQNAKTSLESLQNIVLIAMIVIVVISILLLLLILTLWIRNRIHEIGILLSMGISKGNILLQYITELLMIAVIAFSLSYFVSSVTAQVVSDNLVGQAAERETVKSVDLTDTTSNYKLVSDESEHYKLDVEVSVSNWLTTCSVSMLIILIAITVSAYPLMRLNPKTILSEIN